MSLKFNSLLEDVGLDPVDVRLLRHADPIARKGRMPYELWRDDRAAFLLYQSVQSPTRRAIFRNANYWASFGNTADGRTIFLGIFRVAYEGVGMIDRARPHAEGIDEASTYDWYRVEESELLREYAGRLFIEWGAGTRSWVQHASQQNKAIVGLYESSQDEEFPGYARFIQPLSRVEALPLGWKDALRAARGIYLLTCPRTREQYVGQANGSDGFLGRWLCYVSTGHGDNVALKSREASDYQISILEVAGSATSSEDISEMEILWKQKLQSREMGLNRN